MSCNVQALWYWCCREVLGWSETNQDWYKRSHLSGESTEKRSIIFANAKAIQGLMKSDRLQGLDVSLLAGNVADMSATCRPDTAMSANFSRKGMSRRHKTCEKRPRHTQFIPITADKFKSAQTYEYPSYHRVFVFELKQQSRNCRHLKTCRDMSSNVVSF